MKYLIFPLGNFGDKYKETRHNAGRFVFDLIQKEKALEKYFESGELELFIPECFMNESGDNLKKYLKNKNFETKNIIIIYDDKDLEIGRVKSSFGNADGGHNGIKNIVENLTTKDFWRVRIGIAPVGTGKEGIIPPHGDMVKDYVLAKMSQEEKKILSEKDFLERTSILIENIIEQK